MIRRCSPFLRAGERMSSIRYQRDEQGVVTLVLDAPGQSVNTMNASFRADFEATVTRLEAERDAIRGVILTSAKRSFFAGGDLQALLALRPDDAAHFFAELESLKACLRRLEKLGRPVVAAINGSALGGGFELALACHCRIVADDAKLRVGLPEVTLGLLPGAGGVVRTVRMLGIAAALPLLTDGKRLDPDDAQRAGLTDEAVAPDRLLAAARDWMRAGPRPPQPWDVKGYRLPGGSPTDPGAGQLLAAAPAMLTAKTHGVYPAPEKIL